MRAELNINMIIAQLRKASYELGYEEGHRDALKDFMNRAVIGIPSEEPEPETKDSLEDALGYTE